MKRLAALLLLAGCNSILGIDDLRLSDAGGTVDAPPDTVTGTSMISYIGVDGTVETAPEDLSVYTIEAFVPDGAGGYRAVAGTGRSDGTFEIPEVPEGETYYLMLLYPDLSAATAQLPRFFVTSERVLDLGYHIIGRPDAVMATQVTPVVMNVDGMTPWRDFDHLIVDSYGNGSEAIPDPISGGLTNPPAVGGTTLSAASFDWSSGYTHDPVFSRSRLVDATRGDDFQVAHYQTDGILQMNGSAEWTLGLARIADLFRATDVTMTNGDQVVVSGSFTPVVRDQTQELSIQVASYDGAFADGGAANFRSITINRINNAGATTAQRLGAPLWSVSFGIDGNVPDSVENAQFSYGNPFPPGWGHLVNDAYTRFRRFAVPGASPGTVASFVEADRSATASFTASRFLRAPAMIAIDGVPALVNGGRISFDGTAPVTIAWDQVSQADVYTVGINRFYRDGSSTRRQIVALLTTTETSIAVPPALFEAGQHYAISVTAARGQAGFRTGALRRTTLPRGSARTFTGLFRFGSLCGNGDVDAGEECDPGATETADCDLDCSMRICGDGLANAAAGEDCDHAGDSLGCDADCTPAACGDGYTNVQVEVCDGEAGCLGDCSGF